VKVRRGECREEAGDDSSKIGGGEIVEDGRFRRGEGLEDGWEGDRRWQVQGQSSGGVGDGRSKAGGGEG